ncbi:DUF669 domain-containing protein [Eubacteriales bacterium OttesenSCG-928-K08]|nr:DUF669 domain-containing protein [Eubacteriales bacterium OttesenSCG-928-K08]
MSNNQGYELNWDATIENDGTFEIVPAGDYDFEVLGFERGRHNGSDKIPPCGKVIISIRLKSATAETTINHNLLMFSTLEWKLCEFFTGIGQRKKGEKFQMNWNKVVGGRGRCKVSIRKWLGNNGQEMESNQIDKFYEPEENTPAFQQGVF